MLLGVLIFVIGYVAGFLFAVWGMLSKGFTFKSGTWYYKGKPLD